MSVALVFIDSLLPLDSIAAILRSSNPMTSEERARMNQLCVAIQQEKQCEKFVAM